MEELKKLVELQKIDAEIYSMKKELSERPAYLTELKDAFEAKKSGLKQLEERLKGVLVDRKTLEGDLKVKEENIAKANSQLSLLKTNKEYSAKMAEIEGLKADKSIVEEKILLSYDAADEITAAVAKEKEALAAEEKKYLGEKQKIESDLKALEDRVKVLSAQRTQITPGVQKASLDRYEKILAGKHGLAIVPVAGSSCGGCFMNVPAQVVNEIKMHDKLVYCEMCARILYLPDEVK